MYLVAFVYFQKEFDALDLRRRLDLRTALVYWESNLHPVLSLSNASRKVLFTDRNVLLARTASMMMSLLDMNDHLSNSRAMSVHTAVSSIRRPDAITPLQQLQQEEREDSSGRLRRV